MVGRLRLPGHPTADPRTDWAVPDAMVFVGNRLVINDPATGSIAVLDPSTGNATKSALPGRRKAGVALPSWQTWLVSAGQRAYAIFQTTSAFAAYSVEAGARVDGPWRLDLPEKGHVHVEPSPDGGLLFIYCDARNGDLEFRVYSWSHEGGMQRTVSAHVANPLKLDDVDDLVWDRRPRYLLGSASGRSHVARIGAGSTVDASMEINAGYEHLIWIDNVGRAWVSSDFGGETAVLIADVDRGQAKRATLVPDEVLRITLRYSKGPSQIFAVDPSSQGDAYVGLSERTGFAIYRVEPPR
ncbi:MAG: hypothetical protein LAO51_01825 [Acidobacteriia bacterium]|nr:hypothetical protein [Terriglobia bacterium]